MSVRRGRVFPWRSRVSRPAAVNHVPVLSSRAVFDASVHVLFVCVGNQGRSLMGERLFRAAAGGRHEAQSAGADPGDAPHPEVVDALAELGIDAADHVPRKLDDALLAWADVVVAT